MSGGLARRREEGTKPRKLVLAFDAGYVTCSTLAWCIEERLGDSWSCKA